MGTIGRRARELAVPVVVCALTLGVYCLFSVGQWRMMASPSWDLAIFTEAAKSYSQGHWPIVPIKGPGFNLLGDHFHPILVLLGPVYRVFPSGLTLLIVQNVLLAWSAWPVTRAATRLAGSAGGFVIGLAYGLGWGLQGAVGAQFHEIGFAVPMLAHGGVAFAQGRYRACMAWLAPLVLVKEDLGLTIMVAGLVLAWRRRDQGRRALAESLAFAAFGAVAFVITTQVLLPALNPAGTWAYSLDGSATGAGSSAGGAAAAKVWPSLIEILTFPSVKIATVLVCVLGAGVVGAASPWFALVVPTLAWRFMGSVDFYYGWSSWHYNAVLVPIASAALLDVLGRAAQWRDRRSADEDRALADEAGAAAWRAERLSSWWGTGVISAGVATPLLALAATAPLLPMWQLTSSGFGQDSPRTEAAHQAMAAGPAGSAGETDITLMARMVPDHEVYWVGSAKDMDPLPEYVVVDQRSYVWGGRDVTAVGWATDAHPGHSYELVFERNGFQVARRTS